MSAGLRRVFLARGSVHCDAGGFFVGHVALLDHEETFAGRMRWTPRPFGELEDELSDLYGAPVDLSEKAEGIDAVARALTRGDLALATTCAVHLDLAHPPAGLAKSRRSAEDRRRVVEDLRLCRMLKAKWDVRTGCPPNPGWFAPKDGAEEGDASASESQGLWPPKEVNDKVRRVTRSVLDRLQSEAEARGGLTDFEGAEHLAEAEQASAGRANSDARRSTRPATRSEFPAWRTRRSPANTIRGWERRDRRSFAASSTA